MIFRILATLLVIGIIIGSFFLGGEQHETTSTTTTVDASTAELGYSARNATLVETGADVIRQHPGDGVEFETVQMSFRDNDGQTWKGRANHGELTTETGKVDLSGD